MKGVPERPPQLQTDRPSQRHTGCGSGAELWLLRHAEVHEDWQGKAYGDLDVELSAAGLQRTEELARTFAGRMAATVLCSPLRRARLLGEALGRALGAEVAVHPELREIHRGKWQGRGVDELHRELGGEVTAFYDDPWSYRGHEGENDAMLSERVWPVIDAALRGSGGRPVYVATHYNVIRVLVADALGIPPRDSFRLRLDVGRAALLIDGPRGWRLRRSNVTGPEDAAAASGTAPQPDSTG